MIEKVKEGLKHCSVVHNCAGCPYDHTVVEEPCTCITTLQLDALKVLDGETDWIPATTPPTFPEEEKYGRAYVIVATETSTFGLRWHRTEVRGKRVERWEDDNGIYKGKEIIAWKPFPKPPKEV